MTEIEQVETKVVSPGWLRPLAFSYKGQRIPVVSYGRQWVEDGIEHYLVMDSRQRVFQLAHHQAENRWTLEKSPGDFGPNRRRAS